jgi:carboxylesterase type B
MVNWAHIMQASFHMSSAQHLKKLSRFLLKRSSKNFNFFSSFWTQFAKTGSPSSDLMRWDTYNINESIAFINSTPKIKSMPNKERIKLLHESKNNL